MYLMTLDCQPISLREPLPYLLKTLQSHLILHDEIKNIHANVLKLFNTFLKSVSYQVYFLFFFALFLELKK